MVRKRNELLVLLTFVSRETDCTLGLHTVFEGCKAREGKVLNCAKLCFLGTPKPSQAKPSQAKPSQAKPSTSEKMDIPLLTH